MMNTETKQSTRTRLRRIAGQLEAIERMVEADRDAVDLLHQLAAVQAALGKVGTVVLRIPRREHAEGLGCPERRRAGA
jgi:CsoR family transcriptional regulator, copper-sensing transcriptional repressor